jgi:two-component system nitrate/nitrite response regulator NarL
MSVYESSHARGAAPAATLRAVPPAARVSVLVADHEPIYRSGMIALLQDTDFEVVGDVQDGHQAIEALHKLLPDVALLDAALRGLDGVSVIGAAMNAKLPTSCVCLLAGTNSDAVFSALSAGARAAIPRGSSSADVVAVISAVATGATVIPPSLQQGLADELRRRQYMSAKPSLSAREIEVLTLAAEGLTVDGTASQLMLSSATVKTHLHHVYEKLNVSDKTAAVASAMRWGLLT